MKTLKKVCIWFLLIAMAASLVACGNSAAPSPTSSVPSDSNAPAGSNKGSSEKVTLSFGMYGTANESEGWKAMMAAANQLLADKNIEIQTVSVPAQSWIEYYQKMTTQMAAGTAPDIGRFAESFLPTLINKNQVLDLSDTVSQLDMTEYFEATFKGNNYSDGKYYGVPSGLYHMIMYYNKDLFDAAGVEYPSADWNNAMSFEKTAEVAKMLTKGEGNNKIFGLWAGPYMAYINMYAKSNGAAGIFDANGNPNINSAENKEVFRWFDRMLRTDLSMPTPTVTNVMQPVDLFKAGRIAMLIEGSWYLQTMRDIEDFNVGIAAVPSGKGVSYSTQFVDAFVVFKSTKYPEQAKEAIKAIISEEGFNALVPTGTGGIPITRETINNNIALYFGDSFNEQDQKAFLEGLDHVIPVPYNDYYQDADGKVNQRMDEWTLGKISSDEFAEIAQQIFIDSKEAIAE